MSEIPQDIREKAMALCLKLFSGAQFKQAEDDIASAILALEREVIERCASLQPSTAENPNESDYQRGRFDGIIEFATAIRETAR